MGCGTKAPNDRVGKLRVVSTVGMIADAVHRIGGDHVVSQALMGPGVDPHLYRATAGDVAKLEEADVIFYGGLELEGRMTEIFEKLASRGRMAIPVCERVPRSELREVPGVPGKYDPHVWFDLTLWKHAVQAVADGLAQAKPDAKGEFAHRAREYLAEMDALHRYAQAELAKIPKRQRVLVTAHDAFGYFGRRYDLDVLGIQGTSTASEASAGTLRDLAATISQRKVKAIFVESSVPHATIDALKEAVRAKGWQVQLGGELFSDAMGAPGTREGTYIGMVRHNVDTIVKALQ